MYHRSRKPQLNSLSRLIQWLTSPKGPSFSTTPPPSLSWRYNAILLYNTHTHIYPREVPKKKWEREGDNFFCVRLHKNDILNCKRDLNHWLLLAFFIQYQCVLFFKIYVFLRNLFFAIFQQSNMYVNFIIIFFLNHYVVPNKLLVGTCGNISSFFFSFSLPLYISSFTYFIMRKFSNNFVINNGHEN